MPTTPALEPTNCLLCGADDGVPFIRSRAQMSDRAEDFRFVRCRRCGLVYLDPRVPEARLGAWYGPDYLPHRGADAWGRYARLAAEGQRRMDRARVRWAAGAARLGPGSRMLDVGCGQPTFLEALHRRTGARGTGTDLSDAGWRAEPARWAAAGLTLLQGRVDDLALTPGFELVTLWHALEHEYRPLELLRQLRALVATGGTLIVEVPDLDGLTRRLQGTSWAGYHTPRHTAVYSAATLRAMLERAGWRIVSQPRHGTLDPYVLWWLGQQQAHRRRLDGDLGARFPGFMAGKLLTLPLASAQRWLRLGVQLAIARAL